MRATGPTHEDSSGSKSFCKIGYLGFDFGFVIGHLGLFSRKFFYQRKKLLILGVWRLCN